MVVVVGPVSIPLDVWDVDSRLPSRLHCDICHPYLGESTSMNLDIDSTDSSSIAAAIRRCLDGIWEISKDYGLEYDCAQHFVRSLVSAGSQPRLFTVGDVYSAQQGALMSWDL